MTSSVPAPGAEYLETATLDRHATELVLQRAVDLTTIEPISGAVELTPAAVASIAAEVGATPVAVAVAIAEHQAGVAAATGFLDRFVGPDQVWAHRPSSVDEAATRERARQWLASSHGLKSRVRPDGVLVANKPRHMAGKVAVGFKRAIGGGGLGRVREVQVASVDVDSSPGAVCIVADIGNKRTEAIAGGAAVASGGAICVGAAVFFTGPISLVALPLAAGAGALTSRLVHQSTVRSVTHDVEVTIDAIATNQSPPRSLRNPLGR